MPVNRRTGLFIGFAAHLKQLSTRWRLEIALIGIISYTPRYRFFLAVGILRPEIHEESQISPTFPYKTPHLNNMPLPLSDCRDNGSARSAGNRNVGLVRLQLIRIRINLRKGSASHPESAIVASWEEHDHERT